MISTVKVRSGIVGGVSLLLLMTAIFSATSSSAATGRATPSVTGCRGNALRGVFAQIAGSEGMGHVGFTLRLTNGSSGTCTVASSRAGPVSHISPSATGTALA